MSEKRKKSETFLILVKDEGVRLDRFLALKFPDQSRSLFQRLINKRKILVDEHPASPSHKLKKGQMISLHWPKEEPVAIDLSRPLPFSILYEDKSLFVLNKPAGLLVHPTRQDQDILTLVDYLKPRLKQEEWPEGVRPGLVHRLDRDTSGLLLFAKTLRTHARLSGQFAKRQVSKIYYALVQGIPSQKEGTLESHLARHPKKRKQFFVSGDGRLAITRFHLKESFGRSASFLELSPLTGRTHQIRVQLAHYGHPILGDRVYGGSQSCPDFVKRHMLHAAKIDFLHPETEARVSFEAPLPDDFQNTLKILRSDMSSRAHLGGRGDLINT